MEVACDPRPLVGDSGIRVFDAQALRGQPHARAAIASERPANHGIPRISAGTATSLISESPPRSLTTAIATRTADTDATDDRCATGRIGADRVGRDRQRDDERERGVDRFGHGERGGDDRQGEDQEWRPAAPRERGREQDRDGERERVAWADRVATGAERQPSLDQDARDERQRQEAVTVSTEGPSGVHAGKASAMRVATASLPGVIRRSPLRPTT